MILKDKPVYSEWSPKPKKSISNNYYKVDGGVWVSYTRYSSQTIRESIATMEVRTASIELLKITHGAASDQATRQWTRQRNFGNHITSMKQGSWVVKLDFLDLIYSEGDCKVQRGSLLVISINTCIILIDLPGTKHMRLWNMATDVLRELGREIIAHELLPVQPVDFTYILWLVHLATLPCYGIPGGRAVAESRRLDWRRISMQGPVHRLDPFGCVHAGHGLQEAKFSLNSKSGRPQKQAARKSTPYFHASWRNSGPMHDWACGSQTLLGLDVSPCRSQYISEEYMMLEFGVLGWRGAGMDPSPLPHLRHPRIWDRVLKSNAVVDGFRHDFWGQERATVWLWIWFVYDVL